MSEEEHKKSKRRVYIFFLIVLLIAFLAFIAAQNAQNTADVANQTANNASVNGSTLNTSDIYVNNIYNSDSGSINIKPYHPGEFGYFMNLDPTLGISITNHKIGVDTFIFSANGSVNVWSTPLNMHTNNIIDTGDINTTAGKGLILKSPDGTKCGKLTWTNADALQYVSITCP